MNTQRTPHQSLFWWLFNDSMIAFHHEWHALAPLCLLCDLLPTKLRLSDVTVSPNSLLQSGVIPQFAFMPIMMFPLWNPLMMTQWYSSACIDASLSTTERDEAWHGAHSPFFGCQSCQDTLCSSVGDHTVSRAAECALWRALWIKMAHNTNPPYSWSKSLCILLVSNICDCVNAPNELSNRNA